MDALTKSEQEMLRALRRWGPTHVGGLAGVVGVTADEAENACTHLQHVNLVQRAVTGKIDLTEHAERRGW